MSTGNGASALRKRVSRHDDDLRSVDGKIEDIRRQLERFITSFAELQAIAVGQSRSHADHAVLLQRLDKRLSEQAVTLAAIAAKVGA
jgi:phosphoheptose isomerase